MKTFSVAVALAAGLAAAAKGGTVRFQFTGTVESITGNAPAPMQVGQPFSVAYEFDSATPDTNPDPNLGGYSGAISLIEGMMGPHPVQNYTLGNISVQNMPGLDLYSVISAQGLEFVTFTFADFQSEALTNDLLPTTLTLSQWEVKRFTIHLDVTLTPSVYWEANGTITGFSIGGGCYPDCNASGTLTIADFGCFQS